MVPLAKYPSSDCGKICGKCDKMVQVQDGNKSGLIS